MRCLVSFSSAFAITICLACVAPSVHAQENLQTVSGSGVVTNVRDRHAYVRDDNGNDYVLDFNNERINFGMVVEGIPAPQFKVVGEVEPTVVRAGMAVRVSGKLNNQSQLVDPITQLFITGGDVDPNGSYGISDAPLVLLTDEDVEAGLQAHTIHGQVTQVRGGVITIAMPNPSGGRPLQVQGTADPEVSVELDSTDFGLIRSGDRVEFEGVPTGGGAAPAGQHIFATQGTFTKPDPATR